MKAPEVLSRFKLAIGNAPGELQYHAFDILYLDGFDLRGAALC